MDNFIMYCMIKLLGRMKNSRQNRRISDNDRREFLKALGITGALASGGVTLSEVREHVATSHPSETNFASIGQSVATEVGALDPKLLADGQASFAAAASALPAASEQGLPGDVASPRDDFQQVATAGERIYNHLVATDFFESTTAHLPSFTPSFLTSTVEAFTASEPLAEPLAELGLTGALGTDLVATVVANAEELSQYHWVATDRIDRQRIEFGEYIPPMTKSAAGGALLWLGDLDSHLWEHSVLLTDAILDDAVWHARSMAAGFYLMTEAATAIATDATDGSNGQSSADIGVLLSTGFAIQAIAQGLLPRDVYWITEEMRAPRQSPVQPANQNGASDTSSETETPSTGQ
ncbi:twin-arginine translocation signal domain-containing protein [Natrinema ejinorense]|uniref:Twin-arginine translocation signal domain-containing protein n=1 Tax=Natrinema ejinorense TaxID=373386 RepID=A0A2A5QQC3_9EURY|nr:twin-arginine translocation signal domain-containing protein [Natrinema ejinorense]PCR89014.1 hypothetical protein CP557_21350 [Natrinema ejinorense]